MESINFPLSNIQLELLKLFERDIEDRDLIEIKRLIVKYLSTKLSVQADKVWDRKNWTNEHMDKFLRTHMRTPYNRSK